MSNYIFKVIEKEEKAGDAFTLRNQIFVQEQGIPKHLDRDRYDPVSIHLLAYMQELPIATGRLTIRDQKGILSRIAVIPEYRGKGLGVEIIQYLEKIALERGVTKFALRPHAYLENFYKSLGYITTNNELNIEEIALVEMEKEV